MHPIAGGWVQELKETAALWWGVTNGRMSGLSPISNTAAHLPCRHFGPLTRGAEQQPVLTTCPSHQWMPAARPPFVASGFSVNVFLKNANEAQNIMAGDSDFTVPGADQSRTQRL